MLALVLVIAWGNAVPRRIVRSYVVFSVATTLAASGLYVAIYAIPLYVHPWGTATIAWAGLNLLWLVVMEVRVRDFALCVAGLIMAVLLAVGIADVAGASGRVAGPVLFTVTVAPLLLLYFRGWVHRTIGWNLAWRLFQWSPDTANPDARSFYEQRFAVAERRHDRRHSALARLGLARCRFGAGECEGAITDLASIIEESGALDSMWLCVAQRQLGEWLVITYGTEHIDEAEELADASLRLAAGFAHAHLLVPRTLLLRGVCRYTRGDVDGAHRDAVEAERMLRHHKDASVSPLLENLRAMLAESPDAEGATAS